MRRQSDAKQRGKITAFCVLLTKASAKRKVRMKGRSAYTPPVEGWAVQVVRIGKNLRGEMAYATIFSVESQHFTIAEGPRQHCHFARRMFLNALGQMMRLAVGEMMKSRIK